MSSNRVSLVGIDGLSEEHHALGFPETERPMHPTTHFVADVRIGCKLTAALRSGTRFGRPAYSPRHAYAPSEVPDINSFEKADRRPYVGPQLATEPHPLLHVFIFTAHTFTVEPF